MTARMTATLAIDPKPRLVNEVATNCVALDRDHGHGRRTTMALATNSGRRATVVRPDRGLDGDAAFAGKGLVGPRRTPGRPQA